MKEGVSDLWWLRPRPITLMTGVRLQQHLKSTPEVIDTEEPLEGMNCISTESPVSKLVDPP